MQNQNICMDVASLAPEDSYINPIEGLSPELATEAIFSNFECCHPGRLEISAEREIVSALYILDYASRFPSLRVAAPYCVESLRSFCLSSEFREALMGSLPPPEEEYIKMFFGYWLVEAPSLMPATREAISLTVRDVLSSVAS